MQQLVAAANNMNLGPSPAPPPLSRTPPLPSQTPPLPSHTPPPHTPPLPAGTPNNAQVPHDAPVELLVGVVAWICAVADQSSVVEILYNSPEEGRGLLQGSRKAPSPILSHWISVPHDMM